MHREKRVTVVLLWRIKVVNGNDRIRKDYRRTMCRLKESDRALNVMETHYDSLLVDCLNNKSLPEGKLLQAHMIQTGIQYPDIIRLANKLVSVYAKCGCLVDARRVLEKMPRRNVVSWTAMIAAYSRHGHNEEALALYCQMQRSGIQPNQFTFASVLPACAGLRLLDQGKEIHEEIIRSGFQSDLVVGNAVVDMYAKCGSVENAREMFDKMSQRDLVSWNTIIDGYAKNGLKHEASNLFEKMPERNIVSWNTMISGYAQSGHGEEALDIFRQMSLAGWKPNPNTFASVLLACVNLVALEQGMEIHREIMRCGIQSDIILGNALVDMYAKCGSIDDARHVFDKMTQKDVVSWTAMIAGYAMHGCGEEAIRVFERMQCSRANPDHVTFVGVLSACCHAGLVDQGWKYFNCMSEIYDIMPEMEHYGCMVDLLGRAGHLDEARNFINKMPMKPGAIVWRCLLGACRVHNNLALGECVAECLFQLDPKNATPYVLLSNIYAAVGRWDGIRKVRKMMKDRGIKKEPGCSWIKINKHVYAFLVED